MISIHALKQLILSCQYYQSEYVIRSVLFTRCYIDIVVKFYITEKDLRILLKKTSHLMKLNKKINSLIICDVS